MPAPTLPFLFRPYLLRELPGWGKLYHGLKIHGVDNTSERWRDAPTRTIRGKDHGYQMTLDLRDDLQRATYFLGRYYDLALQLCYDAVIDPGDTFIDVGANIGMTALHAAHLVGPGGKVIAVEPQAECCDFIRRTLAMNNIKHVELINAGLADKPGVLTLNVIGGGTILSTFAECEIETLVREKRNVPVMRGDDLVNEREIVGKLIIKIDVEGFERPVLDGLCGTIQEYRPMVMTEMNAGREGIFEYFSSREYQCFVIDIARRGFKWGLDLRPTASADAFDASDALWVPKESDAPA
jgi:FkbM family methyltransferase